MVSPSKSSQSAIFLKATRVTLRKGQRKIKMESVSQASNAIIEQEK